MNRTQRFIRLCLACAGAALALASPSARAAEPLPDPLKDGVADWKFDTLDDGVVYLNAERAARMILGEKFIAANPRGHESIRAVVQALAERLPAGAALHLGSLNDTFDLRGIRDGIVITGRGTVRLGGGQRGIQILYGPRLIVDRARDGSSSPLRNLTMLFGHCGEILAPVEDSAFIAAVNGWGPRGFQAVAPVNRTLFLWFSVNWSFQDYNAHLGKPDPDWWRRNAQAVFDLKGGGQGTRVYLMVETNYGNPGTGVWLRDNDGLAMLHGATERGSSQGPGVYYLENCRNVLIGLRRNFCGVRGGGSAGIPTHGMTIEGGSGNTLHIYADFANAQQASLVNREDDLRIWCAGMDFEAEGIDRPGVLRFAVTPGTNFPAADQAAEMERIATEEAENWVRARNQRGGLPITPESIAAVQDAIRRGREVWWPINATAEQTFIYRNVDWTRAPEGVPPNLRLPAPPSIPATRAPKTFRPLYFTREPGFGQALLAAGADPTGRRLSDEAFAQVMYGMSADRVQELVARAKAGDVAAYNELNPLATPAGDGGKPKPKKAPSRVRRPTLEIPAGTFRLSRTLHLGELNSRIIGAGSDRTVLRFEGDIAGLRLYHHGGLTGLAIEGGRTGLAITGDDHHAREVVPGGGYNKSYMAGSNFYDLVFRGQTFAGIHIGNEDPAVMGGAEFDQNRFVNLRFERTGDYGIYMNNNMTDKWLVLNNVFEGQRRAGISAKFNHLIHGGIYGSRFEGIDGPGIDFLGGHPELIIVPYIVMVDECEFIECGSATAPAVDLGYAELSSFTHSRVVTRSKPILAGVMGAAQHYENLSINVKLAPGGHAMRLRAVRNGPQARANGHIVRDIAANGPLAFINDINDMNPQFAATFAARKQTNPAETPKINWDGNPAAHSLAPTNGWVHPFLFYRCRFGEQAYAYRLLNVDPRGNRILRDVDLSPWQ